MSFDPSTRVLSVTVPGKGTTARQLLGEGLEEMHPAVYMNSWQEYCIVSRS